MFGFLRGRTYTEAALEIPPSDSRKSRYSVMWRVHIIKMHGGLESQL